MASEPLHQIPTGDPRSTGEVVRDVIAETQTLVRHEIALAKAEVSEAVGAKVGAIAGFVAAGILALYGLGFLAAAAAVGLGNLIPAWLAVLIVAVVFLAVAAGIAMVSVKMVKAPVSLDRTKQRLEEDARWARTQLKR